MEKHKFVKLLGTPLNPQEPVVSLYGTRRRFSDVTDADKTAIHAMIQGSNVPVAPDYSQLELKLFALLEKAGVSKEDIESFSKGDSTIISVKNREVWERLTSGDLSDAFYQLYRHAPFTLDREQQKDSQLKSETL